MVETTTGAEYPMKRLHKDGFFEAVVRGKTEVFGYRLKETYLTGASRVFIDPYSFLPVLSDYDLYLIAEGKHYDQYEKLGAHEMTLGGVKGVFFAVWAPNAIRVSVTGDFNKWDGRRHMMRVRGSTGVWEIFIPGLEAGIVYKYEVKGRYKGFLAEKADPYAFYSELRPKSASDSLGPRQVSLVGRGLDGGAQGDELVRCGHFHLRGPSRLVAQVPKKITAG